MCDGRGLMEMLKSGRTDFNPDCLMAKLSFQLNLAIKQSGHGHGSSTYTITQTHNTLTNYLWLRTKYTLQIRYFKKWCFILRILSVCDSHPYEAANADQVRSSAQTQSNLKQIKMSGTPQTFRAYRIPLYDHMNITNSDFSILFREFPSNFFESKLFF